MKKYFTKYLPVEGEIKAPSYALLDEVFNNAGIVKVISTSKYYSHVEDGGQIWDTMTTRLKPVKLFLCSRDIQVGDKVRCGSYIDMKGWEVFNGVHRDFDWSKELELVEYGIGKYKNYWMTKEGILISYGIKVIGELSPEAKWVKEGDEFDENQVAEVKECVGIVKAHFKIKCPHCGTFK